MNTAVQMSQRTREILKSVYLALMGFLLLSFPYMMVTYTYYEPYSIPLGVWILRCGSAILAVLLGRLWDDRGFRILSVYLLWLFIRVAIPRPSDLFVLQFSESYLTGIWVFTACYGLARILSPNELKTFLRICATIWTLVMTVSCCVGIVAVWRGHRFFTWGDAAFWGSYPVRLTMPYVPTTSGALVGFSALVALCALVCENIKTLRILYTVSIIPMLLALSLTDSRTGFIGFAVGSAVLVYICLIHHTGDQISQEGTDQAGYILRRPLFFMVSLLVFAGTIFVLLYAQKVFHSFRARGGVFIVNAMAEVEGQQVGRGFSGGVEMLSGRAELWCGTLKYLKNNPLVLLIGDGKANPMSGVNDVLGYSMAHTHNMLLMILVESGIPGLGMIIAFVVYSVRKMMIRLRCQNGMFPVVLIAVLLAIVVGDLAECFVWMASSYLPLLPFALMSFGILAQQQSK